MITSPRLPDSRTCALAAALIRGSGLRWRHHGIGLLQAYVVEGQGREYEHRLHVWHPSLCLPDMDDSGLIHDHRFFLESYVLFGAMHDTEIEPLPYPSPPEVERYEMYAIENARSKEAGGEGWIRKVSDETFMLARVKHVYNMGAHYSYPPERFHRSEVEELTVTLVTKSEPTGSSARLLARVGKTPTHAFADRPGRIKDVVVSRLARELLSKAAARLEEIARGVRT